MFLHLSVILSMGVCPSACWDAHTPPGPEADTPPRNRHPPGPDPGPEADPPPPPPREQCMLEDTGNKWVVRILLE